MKLQLATAILAGVQAQTAEDGTQEELIPSTEELIPSTEELIPSTEELIPSFDLEVLPQIIEPQIIEVIPPQIIEPQISILPPQIIEAVALNEPQAPSDQTPQPVGKQELKWGGNANATCGMMVTNDMVNMTTESCTFTGSNLIQVFAGNGAFILDSNTIMGLPGVSSTLNVVTTFSQADRKDNSSCFDFSVTCGPADTTILDGSVPMFMETQNAERPDGDWLNVQIGNWNKAKSFTIELVDSFLTPVALSNITSHMGNITETGSDGLFVFDVEDDMEDVQLLHISLWASRTVDFFQSTVAAN